MRSITAQCRDHLLGDGGVYDMTFWHPNQKPASGVTVYPTVINGGTTHVNITFLNAYEGIRLPNSSNDRVRGLYGSPLHMGLYSGPAFAVPGFTEINFSPDYLAWSGLETDPAELSAHAAYMYNYGTAAQHDGKAAFYANDYTISGYHCGVRFPMSNRCPTPRMAISSMRISAIAKWEFNM
ncbi:MAG: hypothetical protein HC901_02260 [Bdellovibrionaceae bacterium]|nr:hypothetical protein [Pseudobdellovibrionaceae bacterium]